MGSLAEHLIDYLLTKKKLKTYLLMFLSIKLYSFSYSRMPILVPAGNRHTQKPVKELVYVTHVNL